jgi:hypothetical protein
MRTRILKGIDRDLRDEYPLEALQSYAIITACSPSEVLQHFLSTRLESTRSTLAVSSPDSRTVLHVIRSINSTVIEVNTLFPYTFQRKMKDLKEISLLDHLDLHTYLQRKGGGINLWITEDLEKFQIWTKSDVLDDHTVEKMLQKWMDDVESSLTASAGGLFLEIQELDILCALRREIVSSLVEMDEGSSRFDVRICGILVREIAAQITRLMRLRVMKIHELVDIAKNFISNSSGDI